MATKLCALAGVGAALALALPASAAAAVTLGDVADDSFWPEQQAISTGEGYPVTAQASSDPSTPYSPTESGRITQWQTYAYFDTPSAPVAFVVVRPAANGNYTLVGEDPETIPNTLPANGIATFSVSSPISVQPGDLIGLLPTSTTGLITVAWTQDESGTTPADDAYQVIGFFCSSPPCAGLPTIGSTGIGSLSSEGWLTDVAATLVPDNQDAGVTTAASSGAAAGQTVLLSSTVTDNGPGSGGTSTFTDEVPAGMRIDAAAVGSTVCSTSAQTVTCPVSGLGAGQSATVNVVVTPSSAGSYTNQVSVAAPAGVTDPVSSDNSASATVSVAQVGQVGQSSSARCVVPKLRGTAARLAKMVLNDLGCNVTRGKSHSTVRKGLIVKTTPGSGTYAYQHKIKLIISSGPTKSNKG